jgi:hypothetical protein
MICELQLSILEQWCLNTVIVLRTGMWVWYIVRLVDVEGLQAVQGARAMQDQAVTALIECCLNSSNGRNRLAKLLTLVPNLIRIDADQILKQFFVDTDRRQVDALWKTNVTM